ncbi:transglutaminase domain-containing protein [Candidatus Woesearchaeota archaeon]|nr:transglutaminase domain-containing protein [Candidatus Woesearchaeota archaeon]
MEKKKLLLVPVIMIFIIPCIYGLTDILDMNTNAELLVEYRYIIHSDPGEINIETYSYPINTSTQIVERIESNMKWEGDRYTYKGYTNGELRLWIKAWIKSRLPIVINDAPSPTIINSVYEITPTIKQEADKITYEKNDLLEIIGSIIAWVHDNINYTEEEPYTSSFIPPSRVIEEHRGVCDEMAALAIAMLNSQGIEARMISGLAYSNKHDKWMPHAWIEARIGKQWIPFDPSYDEYSSLDPGHIALRIGDSDRDIVAISSNGDIDISTDYNVEVLKTWKRDTCSISLKPIHTRIGPNSYGVLELEIYNPLSSWIVDRYTAIGPEGLEFMNNDLIITIPPKSHRKEYIVYRLVDKLARGYIYTYPILITSSRCNASTSIEAMESYPIVEREEIDKYLLINEKKLGSVNCSLDRSIFYDNESINIKCFTEEKGVDIALSRDIGVEKRIIETENGTIINLNISITTPGRKGLTIWLLKNNELIATNYIELTIIKSSGLELAIDLPKIINYSSILEKTLYITTPGGLGYRDIVVSIETPFSIYRIRIDKLDKDTYTLFTLDGSDFYAGNNTIRIRLSYTDLMGNTHVEEEEYHIYVRANTLEERIIGFIKRLAYILIGLMERV